MDLLPYSYCFLRYYHDALAGEFANVGVVVWSPQGAFLGHRFSPNYRRLSGFFEGFHSDDYRGMIHQISSQFDRFEKEVCPTPGESKGQNFESVPNHARDLAIRVVPHDDGAIRWSESAGGVTADPEAELDRLFHHVVGRHYEDHPGGRNDSDVFREVYSKAFEIEGVSSHIVPHEVVAPHAKWKFNHAWKNGVWNVYEPISFDLQREDSIERKSFIWESRARYLAQAEESPNLHFLLGEPGAASMKNAFFQAIERLQESACVELIREGEADEFAKDLRNKIQNASLS